MVNTNMFEFKHPKYYKELRKRNRAGSIDRAMLPDSQSDQAISESKTVDIGDSVRPGPGLKPQATSSELQAASNKHQATSSQTSSNKPQATSNKHQAASHKQQAPR